MKLGCKSEAPFILKGGINPFLCGEAHTSGLLSLKVVGVAVTAGSPSPLYFHLTVPAERNAVKLPLKEKIQQEQILDVSGEE